jgi:hypothetical protein
MPRAKLYRKTGYHIEVDGVVFKSAGAAGYGGGDSSHWDKKRREVAELIVKCVNMLNQDSRYDNSSP